MSIKWNMRMNEANTAEVRVEKCGETELSGTLFKLLGQALFSSRILNYLSPFLYKLF